MSQSSCLSWWRRLAAPRPVGPAPMMRTSTVLVGAIFGWDKGGMELRTRVTRCEQCELVEGRGHGEGTHRRDEDGGNEGAPLPKFLQAKVRASPHWATTAFEYRISTSQSPYRDYTHLSCTLALTVLPPQRVRQRSHHLHSQLSRNTFVPLAANAGIVPNCPATRGIHGRVNGRLGIAMLSW